MTQILKFNPTLLKILKNFNSINELLIFRPGNRLFTHDQKKTVFAHSNLDFEIEEKFIIADLYSFLSGYSLFSDPTLKVSQEEIVIEGDRKSLRYKCGSLKLDKEPDMQGIIEMPSVDVQVKLSQATLTETFKAAKLLAAPEIVIMGDEGKLFLKVTNLDNPSATSYVVELDGKCKHNFNAIFNKDRLLMEPVDYELELSLSNPKNMVSHFKNNEIEYWIALQATSTFTKEEN